MMKNTNRYVSTLFSFLLLVSATSVQAAPGESFIGFGYGTTSVDTGITPVTASLDEDDTGFKFFGGHQINNNIIIEGFYANLGEATLSGNAGDTFIIDGALLQFLVNNASLSAEGTALGVSALVGGNVSDSFSIFGKLGLAKWDLDLTASGTGVGTSSTSEDGTDIFFGLVASYRFNKDWSIRGDFDKYKFGGDVDTDVDMLSVNIVKWF